MTYFSYSYPIQGFELQGLADNASEHCAERLLRWGMQAVLVAVMARQGKLRSTTTIEIGPAVLQSGKGSRSAGTQAAHLGFAIVADGKQLHEHFDPQREVFARECAKLASSATQTLATEINQVDSILEMGGVKAEFLKLITFLVNEGFATEEFLDTALAGGFRSIAAKAVKILKKRRDREPGTSAASLKKIVIIDSYINCLETSPVPRSVQSSMRGTLEAALGDFTD